MRRVRLSVMTMLWLAGAPAPALAAWPTLNGELFMGGGYDTNLFLQIAASPSSPNYHSYSGALVRLYPALAGALAGEGYRLELRYGADLRQTFGSGRLYVQDLDLALVLSELGPTSWRVAATAGRFDAGDYPSDHFLAWGGEGEGTLRFLDHLRAIVVYRIDRRYFAQMNADGIDSDLTHLFQVRLAYKLRANLELSLNSSYLYLRSELSDPTQPVALMDRVRGGVGVNFSPLGSLTLIASLWVGRQVQNGTVGTDTQIGCATAVLIRVVPKFDVVVRYDGYFDRAMASDSSYSRHSAALGIAWHFTTSRRPRPTDEPPDDKLTPSVKGTRIRFRLLAPEAKHVEVIGSWNGWAAEPGAQALERSGKAGVWERWVEVGLGEHRYHFVVDGQAVRPVDAPQYRPDGFGGEDGVIETSGP